MVLFGHQPSLETIAPLTLGTSTALIEQIIVLRRTAPKRLSAHAPGRTTSERGTPVPCLGNFLRTLATPEPIKD